jgi:hypothetical protein
VVAGLSWLAGRSGDAPDTHARGRIALPHSVVGIALVLHGLITTMIGIGSATNRNAAAMAMPSWMNWWPGPFGRSWVLDSLNLGSAPTMLGGLLWLAAGLALIGAGLGWLDVLPLGDQWPRLALAGGVLGLLALTLFFHPFYLVAVVLDVAIVVLAWSRLATS